MYQPNQIQDEENPRVPTSKKYPWTRGEKIAAGLSIALTVFFVLLILPTYFIADILHYPDQEYVDETQEPLTDFSRYSCPLYYLTPEAMEASKNFTAYRPVSGIIAFDPVPVITGEEKGTKTENFYEWFTSICQFEKETLKEADGPKQNEFLEKIFDEAFERVGGWRYKDLMAQNDIPLDELWWTSGMLRRRFNIEGPVGVTVLEDYLNGKKSLTFSAVSFNLPATVLNFTEGENMTAEFEEYATSVKLSMFSILKVLEPLQFAGTNESASTEEGINFYNMLLNFNWDYRLAVDRASWPKEQDKRKFSKIQANIAKEKKAMQQSVGQLAKQYPNIGWRALLTGLLPGRKITNDTKVVMTASPKYLKALNEFFADSNGITALRLAQISHLLVKIIGYFQMDCDTFLAEYMPHAKGYSYIKMFPQEEVETKVYYVTQMVKPIMEQYKAAIRESNWPTEGTKNNLIQKLKSMKVSVGWPDWYKLYEPMAEGKEAPIDVYHQPWLGAIKNGTNYTGFSTSAANASAYDENTAIYGRILLKIVETSMARMFAQIGQKIQYQEAFLAPSEVNAQYRRTTNSLSIAYGWINRYFSAEKMVESYGKIGHTIAHEIGHGYDNEGMFHGADGLLNDKLLDKKSAQEFDKIQQCVVQLYATECCPLQAMNSSSNGPCADGWFTQSENFADISGVTIAYRAFKQRQRLLHGGHFELAKRKFWVGYGSLWCGFAPSEEELGNQMLTDVHPPAVCRINLVTKSVPQFAYDFGSKSPLLAGKQCNLWPIQ